MDSSPLDIPLTTELDLLPHVKCAIIAVFSDTQFSDSQFAYNEPWFAVYIQYYESECHHSARTVPFQTHRQLLDAISTVSDERHKSVEDLRTVIAGRCLPFGSASHHEQRLGITLCLRLWLMINIRDPADGNSVLGPTDIIWDDNAAVQDLVRSTLAGKRASRSSRSTTLDEDFHALNLHRLADIDLVPTGSLADHLYLDTTTLGRPRLYIFRCGFFLTVHLTEMRQTKLWQDVFDDEFLRETQRTYNLLFPPWQSDCVDYLRKLQKLKRLDQAIGNIPHGPSERLLEPPIRLSDFPFYGQRLEILNKALSSAKPTSLSQLWFDRRNKQTWYTMWIAVVVFLLTFFFGVTSMIIGIMQVWLAWKS